MQWDGRLEKGRERVLDSTEWEDAATYLLEEVSSEGITHRVSK